MSFPIVLLPSQLLEMRELSVYWNPYIPEQHLIRSRTNTDGWRVST